MKPILLDTSFLYALYDLSDRNRKKATEFVAERTEYVLLVPQVVLAETAYMISSRVGERGLISFMGNLESPRIHLESVIKADIKRAREIMVKYTDARFDFVDCCIMALAERLAVTQICTFDRRDFSIFRPVHAEYLELLP